MGAGSLRWVMQIRPCGGDEGVSQTTAKAALMKAFKAFLSRGNVGDLAVGIIIGVAFGAMITGLVTDMFTPLVAAIVGKSNLAALTFTISGSVFYYGRFISAFVAFLSMASAIFLFVVKPLGTAAAARPSGEIEPVAATRICRECRSEIPAAAARCAYCAQPQARAA